MTAIKPLGIWFGSGGASMEEGSPLDRYVLTILALIGIIILTKRRFSWFSAFKDNIWVFLLLSFMLVSIIWSDMPFASLKRWMRELIAVIMALIVATELKPIKALMSIFKRIIYIVIPFSYILIQYFPHLGRLYDRWFGKLIWIGVASAKNGLALLSLFAIFIFAWSFIGRRRGNNNPISGYQTYIEIFIMIIAIWLFMGPSHSLTYSATSTVTLIIGLMSLIGLQWIYKHRIFIHLNTLTIIILAVIVLGTATSFYGGLMMSDVAFLFNRNETLTGRTDIWAYLIPYAMSNPLGGHGFGGFWTDAHREATSSHAHNGYLDIVLNIGFVGLILFSSYLLHCCRRAHKLLIYDFDKGCLWICILLMIVVNNMTESSVTSFTDFLAAINLFMLMSTSDNL